MKPSIAAAAAALTTLFVSSLANAQTLNPARFDDEDHVVFAGFGADGPALLQAGYAPILPVDILGGRLALPMRLELPIRPSFGDWGAAGGAQLATIDHNGFGVSGRIELSLRREEMTIANITKIGGAVTLLGGWFRERGSIALELGWEPGLATRVSPTDAYRRQAYPGAHSTWMGGNSFFRAGVQGVLRVTGNTELTVRSGLTRTDHLNPMDMLPFYAMVGINQGF